MRQSLHLLLVSEPLRCEPCEPYTQQELGVQPPLPCPGAALGQLLDVIQDDRPGAFGLSGCNVCLVGKCLILDYSDCSLIGLRSLRSTLSDLDSTCKFSCEHGYLRDGRTCMSSLQPYAIPSVYVLTVLCKHDRVGQTKYTSLVPCNLP